MPPFGVPRTPPKVEATYVSPPAVTLAPLNSITSRGTASSRTLKPSARSFLARYSARAVSAEDPPNAMPMSEVPWLVRYSSISCG